MKKLLHILKHEFTLDQYYSSKELLDFISDYNIDGFEIICCDEEDSNKIPNDKIIGYHLGFFSYWIDLWNFNPKRLIAEFGDAKTCLEFYGLDFNVFTKKFNNFDWSLTNYNQTQIESIQNYLRNHIIAYFKKDCDNAHNMSAEYVVFHVSNVNINETLTYNLENDDMTIIKASIEIINSLLKDSSYKFEFLIENLWWNGLNFINPNISFHLIQSIDYEKKGFVLDVGHLLNTNINIENEVFAMEYLNRIVDIHTDFFHKKNTDFIKHIKAVHLHQSLSGKYVKQHLQNLKYPLFHNPNINFYEKFKILYDHVLKIDTHSPITFKGTLAFIEKLNPAYLVFEITENNREKLKNLLDIQLSIFN